MGDTDFGDIRNDDWVQDHFKIKQLPVTSRQQPSEPNIREISYLTRELSWAYGFHDDSNFLTPFVCRTKSISFLQDLLLHRHDVDALDVPYAGLPGDGDAEEELQVRQGLGSARQGSLARPRG